MLKFIAAFAMLMITGCAAKSRAFEMGMIYWPPLGEATSAAVRKMGIELTLANSDVVLVQLPWNSDSSDVAGMAEFMSAPTRAAGKKLAIAIDWQDATRQRVTNGFAHPWQFGDAATAGKFLASVDAVERRWHPDYFVLAVEVNYYARTNPADFTAFVEVFKKCREQIHAADPCALVLATFQWELLTGRDATWGMSPDFSPITAFGNSLDIVGISTYPHLAGMKSSDFSNAYFAETSKLKPSWGIFETSWPTVTEAASQAEYMRKLLKFCNTAGAKILIWTATVDTAELPKVEADKPAFNAAAQWMQFLGLFTLEGKPKAATQIWQQWFNRRFSING